MRANRFRRARNFACTRCEPACEHVASPQRVAKSSSFPRGAPEFRMALACPSGQVARVTRTSRAAGTGGLPSCEGYFPSREGSPARRPHPVTWGAVQSRRGVAGWRSCARPDPGPGWRARTRVSCPPRRARLRRPPLTTPANRFRRPICAGMFGREQGPVVVDHLTEGREERICSALQCTRKSSQAGMVIKAVWGGENDSPLLVSLVMRNGFKTPVGSIAASALVAELLDCAAACRLDYATALVAASQSAIPPSVGGECALGTDVLEDRQEDFECLAATVPHFASMLLGPEKDPDAPDILTPRSYAKAITGPYSSKWQAAMDAKMASWKSTGTYIDEVPPPGANIVDGMWIFRGVDYFQTFSPTPKMTTLRVLLHVAAQRDYELHSLDFSTAFLQGSLHEDIWLRRPPGFTGTTTLAALGFAPSTAYPSLFLRTDTSLPPFYVLMYITRDRAWRTITLTQSHMVQQVLQRFGFQFSSPQLTPLSTSHSLSAPPSDESVEPSGPYPELVGCLMYLMTCTRHDLAYPLSLLARYVAPGRHRKVHWDAAKRVLRYLCSMSGMGLVLGGRCPVVLTGHADASWVDDSATQRLSQGYTSSLGFGSISWWSTRSSLVLSSSCEAEIYAETMVAQELRWLTYLLTDLGE
ncbi:unnamed protein product [Closterium sp. NIES-53]